MARGDRHQVPHQAEPPREPRSRSLQSPKASPQGALLVHRKVKTGLLVTQKKSNWCRSLCHHHFPHSRTFREACDSGTNSCWSPGALWTSYRSAVRRLFCTQMHIKHRALTPRSISAPVPTCSLLDKNVWCREIDQWCTQRLIMVTIQHLLGQLLSRLVVMCVTAGLVVSQRCLVPCPQAPVQSTVCRFAWCQFPPHQSRHKLRLLPKVPVLSCPAHLFASSNCAANCCAVPPTHGAALTILQKWVHDVNIH